MDQAQKQNNQFGIFLLVALAVVVVWGGYTLVNSQTKNPVAIQNQGSYVTNYPTDITSSPSPSKAETVSYAGRDGVNALELLKENATPETKDSSFGEYVDAINGISGGTDNKYWSFYINGKLSTIGAADYVTKNEDTIEWRFE